MGARISVRGRSRGSFDSQSAAAGIRNEIGPSTTVSTRLTDDRTTLNAQKLSSIMSR
jgi:hypothetical protein